MIRVNLIGGPKKKAGKAKGGGFQLPTNLLPILWAAVILGAAGYGYLWRGDLMAQSADLSDRIASAEAQKAQLQFVIDQDAVFEGRKAMLESRIAAIESLQRDQVSPVVSLDILSQAINETEYVWLSQLGQSNTQFNLAGTGTSNNAIADFMSSLEATGYFRNINLVNMQGAEGAVTFSLSCEFVPPALPRTVSDPAEGDSGEDGDGAGDDGPN